MIHTDRGRGMKIVLDALSPEKITNERSTGKVLTSATAELDFNGCAMELLPYAPICDPHPGVHTAS